MTAIALATSIGTTTATAQTGQPVAVPDSLSKWILGSSYDGGIRGGVSDVSMRNKISGSLNKPGWLGANASVEITERDYRLQNKRNDSKRFLIGLGGPLRPGLQINTSFSDSRFFDRVITAQNRVQDFTNDSKNATAGVNYSTTLPNAVAVTARANGGLQRSEQTFEKTNAVEGGLGSGVRWGTETPFWGLRNRVSMSARGWINLVAEESEPGGLDTLITGLGGQEDSLAAAATYWLTQTTNVKGSYSRYTKTREYMDLPRGVFLDQDFEGELIRETETRNVNVYRVDTEIVPVTAITLKMSGQRTESLSDYAVATRRFNETTTDQYTATVTYRLPKNIVFDTSLENTTTDRYLGPQSLGSYTDRRKSLKLSLNLPVTKSLNATLQTGTSILQTFYVSADVNPRDRDQLDQYANLRVTSLPFPKISAQIYLGFNQQDFVSIDATFSQNNRTESTWDMRPEFTYKLNERIEIKQTYGMNLEFTDFHFAPDDNFLDRNFSFRNGVRVRLFPSLSSDVSYRLVLHDRGSYLVPEGGGERLLDITQEDRRDEMLINFRYAMGPRLAVVGGNDYSQRQDQFAGSARRSFFRDGGLYLGVEGDYEWGPGRALNFKVKRVKKFGRFNSPEQQDFWEMDSTLAYKF